MEKKVQYDYYEVMRILACFFVIFNHTAYDGFFLFARRPIGGAQFWSYLFISIFCKFAVPMFFAISGALLLSRKDEKLITVYRHRVLKFFLCLVVFSFFYYFVDVWRGKTAFSLKAFFLQLYSANWNFSFWYLYAFIAFLIILPLLRPFAQNLDNRAYWYMIALYIVFQAVIPVFQYVLGKDQYLINENLKIGFITSRIVFFPMLGYFLEHRITNLERKGKIIVLLWVINFITICLCCYLTYIRAADLGEITEQNSKKFHSVLSSVNTATIFLSIKYIFVKFGDKMHPCFLRILRSVGTCTFGIYILHVLILKKWKYFQGIWDALRVRAGLNYMLTAFIVCFIIMLITYIITWILKKIPVINKLL